jgi:hypothetical protein
MDDNQKQAWEESIERKKAQAKERSESPPTPGGDKVPGDPDAGLIERDRPQDVGSPRQKSTGHKKVTADKWNQ